MSISKGQTFGITEQITNTKLHNLVDLATITLEHTELSTGILTSLPSSAGTIPSYNLIQSMASGNLLRYDGTNGFYASAS